MSTEFDSLIQLESFLKYISRVELVMEELATTSLNNKFSEPVSNLEGDISGSECNEDLSNASDLVNVLKYLK